MIEHSGKVLKVSSGYALVRLAKSSTNSRFCKILNSVVKYIKPNCDKKTIRVQNSIYAKPNDTVIIGLAKNEFFRILFNNKNKCIDTPAIILRYKKQLTHSGIKTI